MPPSLSDPNEFEAEPSGSGLQLGDIYYILFRHKWKIAFFAIAGIVAAGVMFKITKPLYSSQAKLLVHYVTDPKSPIPGGGDVRMLEMRTDTILNSEMEILGSFDLLRQVAQTVGPAQILGVTNEVENGDAVAAAAIKKSLKVEPPGRGNILAVEFLHADPRVAQEVVRQLIDLYFIKHKEIHSTSRLEDDVLARKVDEFKNRIAEIDVKLKNLKTSANIVSIDETKKANLDQSQQIRTELFATRARLAEREAALARMTNSMAKVDTNRTPATTNVDAGSLPAGLDEYRRVVGKLEWYLKQEQVYSTQFTESNSMVRELRAQVLEMQREKKRMEQEDPSLLRNPSAFSGLSSQSTPADPLAKTVFEESYAVAGLIAKIAELTNQFAFVRAEASRVAEVENQVLELQRQKEIEESRYKTYLATAEQKRVEEMFLPGKLPNISWVQKPTPPAKEIGKLYKKLGMVAGGGIGAGLALAFLIELFLDQSVRRPNELQKKLRLPVFVSLPRLKNLRSKAALAAANRKALKAPEANGSASLLPALHSISATNSLIQPYCDALRDRLVHFFQRNNMTHKPKLVAVTGCGHGSGVSTIAAGLAASLSETGDGNVLLVDTNVTEGAAHPFYRGKLACGINEVLKEDRRGDAQVQDHLYVAAANDADGAFIKALPKRFSQLVPKLKASDYDYIIFDLPPVTQTSITSKLAGYMDMVLLVVESEKTGRGIVAEATDLLRESRANVATVLNKTRRYVPQWVHREFE